MDRIIEQYAALKLYFQGMVLEDPTHTTDAILKSLRNKFTQAYLEFMTFNLGRLTSFNKLFQSNLPLLHVLRKEVTTLLSAICSDFIQMGYIRQQADIISINPRNEHYHVPLTRSEGDRDHPKHRQRHGNESPRCGAVLLTL